MNASMIDSDCENEDNVSDDVSDDCSEDSVSDDDSESQELEDQSLPTFSNDLDFVARIAQETMITEVADNVSHMEEIEVFNDPHAVHAAGGNNDPDPESSDSSSDDYDDDDIAARADEMIDDEEEDNSGGGSGAPLRTKHEVVEDDIPLEPIIEDIPENISLIGEIISCIPDENTIVIQSIVTNEPLDEGSVLCLRDKTPLGKISEIFGPLTQPFYIVKFKSHSMPTPGALPTAATPGEDSMVEECSLPTETCSSSASNPLTAPPSDSISQPPGQSSLDALKDVLTVGVKVFAPIGSSAFVTPLSLQTVMSHNRRGTDASNLYDEEVCVATQRLIIHRLY
jgi:hypothetical protein